MGKPLKFPEGCIRENSMYGCAQVGNIGWTLGIELLLWSILGSYFPRKGLHTPFISPKEKKKSTYSNCLVREATEYRYSHVGPMPTNIMHKQENSSANARYHITEGKSLGSFLGKRTRHQGG